MTIQEPGSARGRWLLLAAGLVLLGCFFLPWLRFVIAADQRVALSLTGLQGATMPVVETTDGGLLYRSSFWLYLAPIAGLFALALALLSLLPGRSASWHGLLAITMGAFAAVALWGAFSAAQEVAEKQKVVVEAHWGLSLTFLALLLLLVGGLALLREVSAQQPAFRAVLDALNFMAPGTVLVIVFFLLPAVILFILSLTDLSSANFSEPWTYVGFDNYKRMFSDRFFPKILRNTFQYVILTLLFFNVGLALALALPDGPREPTGRILLSPAVAAAPHHPVRRLHSDVAAHRPAAALRHSQSVSWLAWRRTSALLDPRKRRGYLSCSSMDSWARRLA